MPTADRIHDEQDDEGTQTRASTRRWVTVLTVLITLPWLGFALLRAFGLERGFPLVPALAFTPYAALTAPLPMLVALLLRRWRSAALAGFACVLLAAVVLPRAIPAADEDGAGGGPVMRVLTVNMGFGEAPSEEIVRLVAEHEVDVLALQEVTPEAAAGLEQAGLDELLPHAMVHDEPAAAGGAVHARHPVTPLGDPGAEIESLRMPHAQLEVADAPAVEIVSVHPMPPRTPGQMQQWQDGLRALPAAEPGGPVRLLAGDFNATLDHAELRSVLDQGYLDAAAQAGRGLIGTWPVSLPLPKVTLDRVVVDQRVAVHSVSVLEVAQSDHLPVLAELELPAD